MVAYVNSGIGAQLLIVPETTYGVVPTTGFTGATSLEFDSETLELKKTVVQGKGLHGGGLYNRGARRVLTNYSVSGGIKMDLPTQGLNPLLKLMFGSKGQSLASLTQIGTDAAYQATHAPGSLAGTSLTIQKGVPSVDGTAPSPFTYVGMKLTDWQISVATGALASLDLTFDGRNELAGAGNGDPNNTTVPALGTFSEPTTASVFHFREATLFTGGTTSTTGGVTQVTGQTPAGNVKSAEIKCAFKMDTSRYFLGANGFKAEPIENDFREISGQFMIEWLNSEAMYNAFSADTPTSLELSFIGPNIGTGSDKATLNILIPQIFLEGDSPKVGGPGVVEQTVAFTGLDNGKDNVIQATYITLDNA